MKNNNSLYAYEYHQNHIFVVDTKDYFRNGEYFNKMCNIVDIIVR